MRKILLTALALATASILSANPRSVCLNGEWNLSFWEQPSSGAITAPSQMEGIELQTIPSIVPGNVEIDLEKAGIIEDPMIGANVNKLRKYEGYQWCYTRSFDAPVLEKGQTCELFLGGVDCFAEVWLNGQHIASLNNSLIEHSIDITGVLRQGSNDLCIILRSSVLETQKNLLGAFSIGDFASEESIYARKAPHCYGWDIMPRMVSAGLWRDVRLDIYGETRINNVNWMVPYADAKDNSAWLRVDLQMRIPFREYDKAKVVYKLSRNGKTVLESEQTVLSHAMRASFHLTDIDLWWPRGFGEAALYDASVTVIGADGKVLDSKEEKIGLRTVYLEYSELNNPPEEPGIFRFVVNGIPVFIRGTNWVPMDAMHSRDNQWIDKTMDMVVDLNCNMIRCWGGNVYEDHQFFDRCDRDGIMVWQDFVMGCAFYSQREDFAKAIEEEAIAVVTKLRNHPSLALWSGNNEDDQTLRAVFGLDPNRDVVSRGVLPRVIYEFDPTRTYLPSSPFISEKLYQAGFKAELATEDHLWGPRGYYKDGYYVNPPCQFVSEIGYHGCPNRSSLEKMMPSDEVYPWENVKERTWNNAWLTKATRRYEAWGYTPDRNNLMINQVNILFGECPEKLDDFIMASQFVQAEAMKYFVEKWRGAKFNDRWGIIWWNVRDGWPIISDAVTDYWCSKKLAYHYIKNVQYDVCVMMLDKVDGKHPLVAVNDTRHPAKGKVKVSDLATGKQIYSGEFTVEANSKLDIASISMDGYTQGFALIEYEIDGVKHSNHYLYGEPPYKLDDMHKWVRKMGIYDSECLGSRGK